MPILFAITLFVSATLLFLVQPMFGKIILPMLGGTPMVWITCMVFFQAALLAGYGYAHATTTRLGIRRHALLHVAMMAAPLLVLPFGIGHPWDPRAQNGALAWLLMLLVVSIGLPFFAVSTSAPVLQRWFANTSHPSAKDPYFLYSTSNVGSVLALLSYPTLVEPNLRLLNQSRLWAAGYGLLVILVLCCALVACKFPARAAENSTEQDCERDCPTPAKRARWLLLAFAPSSLMLGVTTYLTTDIAPVPLLWIIPLTIYLFTFIVVFARRPVVSHTSIIKVLPIPVLLLVVVMVIPSKQALWWIVPVHLVAFFFVALTCHGELAASRPPAKRLTEFYLWMSAGGVLGGLFNAVIAPVVFSSLVEYPLALVLACLLSPNTSGDRQNQRKRWIEVVLPLVVGLLSVGAFLLLRKGVLHPGLLIWLLLPPVLLCYSSSGRPVRFAFSVGAILVASLLYSSGTSSVLHRERSFFGIYRIMQDPQKRFHFLFHGTTLHGLQSLEPALSREPLSYFHRTGPIGQVFSALSGSKANARIAVVGLGAGSLACYGEPGQQFTFYEIDPAVERIASDPKYFTFLRDSPFKLDVVLGDARLSLLNAPDAFDIVVLDAFSSDAIPVHLLTREALELYLSSLADKGVLAFHISNRYLDLRPVLGDLAQQLGLVCIVQDDRRISVIDAAVGKLPSVWLVMARKVDDLGKLASDIRWEPQPGRAGAKVWTDDFSDIIGVLNWK